MCYHNYTVHSGCGHMGESHTRPWTLCPSALHHLNHLRGPNSPPLSPPAPAPAPPKRSASTRRFFSLSGTLARSSTGASSTSRRAISGPTPRASPSSHVTPLDYATLPDHQLAAVKCRAPTKRTHVSVAMEVCKVCARHISDMRCMIALYDKSGSIRGTSAFERFLRWEGEGGGDREGDLTVPLDEEEGGGLFGARQAIVMGCRESVVGRGGLRGLGALEREKEVKRFEGRGRV